MEKTITLIKKSFRQIKRRGMILLALGSLASIPAMGQYTSPTHYYGCSWSTGTYTYAYYAAIEDVTVTDAAGNVLYSKAADDCNQTPTGVNVGHYNEIETTPAFTLTAGATYTVTVGGSNPNSSTTGLSVGVWIDFDGNGSFGETENWIGVMGMSAGGSNSLTFTAPCNVTTSASGGRMRIRSNANWYTWSRSQHSISGTAGAWYGETEDFACDFDKPTAKVANFFAPDTAYVGTIVKFQNSSSSAGINEWDVNADGILEGTSRDFEHVFSSVGTYDVKLKIVNCAGTDSMTKSIVIIAPTAAPVADFVATKNVVELFDIVTMVDLSSNGATYWDWLFINGSDTIDGTDMFSLQGGDPYVNKNPEVFTGTNPAGFPKIFPDRGLWTVCLRSSNSIGTSAWKCKTDYIEVTKTSFNMGPETSLPANVITATEGTLYDKGGPDNNYTVPEANLEALIAPCGAKSVTVVFKQFKLNANANLKIFDGENALGTPLHSGNGFTKGNEPSGPITANSGMLYLLWNSSTGATDSGFIADWTSVLGSSAKPIADFDLPAATIYNAVSTDFMNTSVNAEGNVDFEWYIDGTLASLSRDLTNQLFLTNGNHCIKLRVISCDGSVSEKLKCFTVAHPGTPTELDFEADNRRPRAGEQVVFTATSEKANQWVWTVFPNTGVTQIGIDNSLPEGTFQFDAPGKYTVQCHAYNVIDSTSSENTVIKANYIIVVQHCKPIVSVTTSTDMGISQFKLTENSTGDVMINNKSVTGVDYEDFSEDIVELNFGGVYDFEVSRSSTVNPMNRKMWIDWNVDGDFDDAGEEVASEATGNGMTWTGSFTVPDAANAFAANTVMRIGVSYNTDANTPCGPNRIGEFEDYGIRVVNDGDNPVITLIGNDTVYVEQGKVYVDAGATAWDPSQGDITSDIVTTSNVDTGFTGIYSVEYCVEDASGNVAECKKRIVYVVVDQTAPVLTLNGSAVETLEVGTPWVDAGATATDNKSGNLDAAIVVTGSVDHETLGTYLISYYVQDAQGNSSELIRTVHVVDTEAPVISNASAFMDNGNWRVNVQLKSPFTDVTTFSDNYNSLGNNLVATATPGIGFEGIVDTRYKGTTAVTYTATDESGNTTVMVIRYVVEDYIAPQIDLHTLDTIWHDVNTTYKPVDATASDNLYDNTQISLSMTSDVNPYELGTYYDVYTAIDASGNTSTRTRTVKVVDREAPSITGKNGAIVRVGLYSEFAAIERLVFADNYDSPADIKANTTLLFTDINTYEEGLYTATFRTVDNSGNESDEFTLYILVSRNYLRLGVEDLELADLMTVAPNPTTGVFTINVDLPQNEDISVEVYNAVGQQVVSVVEGNISNGSYVVDLSGHANGIYYVKMNVRGTIVTKKVMLNQ